MTTPAVYAVIDSAVELAGDTGDYLLLAAWADRERTEVKAAWSNEPYRRDLAATWEALDMTYAMALLLAAA